MRGKSAGGTNPARESRIIYLPSTWLTLEERSLAFEALFTEEEKKILLEFRRQNLNLLKKAKAIVVDIRKADGFLGDTIRDSFLVGAFVAAYPQKLVFLWSRCPELLAKYRFITRYGQNKEKVALYYQETPQSSEREAIFKSKEVAQISPAYNSISPIRPFGGESSRKLVFHEIPLHQLHRAQILWEVLYNIEGSHPTPKAAIKISRRDAREAEKIFRSLFGHSPVSSGNIILHPDAHPLHFEEKNWPKEKWLELLKTLSRQNPSWRFFLSTGVNHPEVSQAIAQQCSAQKLPLKVIPPLSLAQYAGLLKCFPQDKTVFLGLESMAGTHLAPALGLKTVVIAAGKLFNPSIYGPFGGTVVFNEETTAASVNVAKVAEAVLASLSGKQIKKG